MNAKAYFARHAQVFVGSLGRIAQQPLAAFMTMAVIAVALALPLFLYLFLQNVRSASAGWSEAFDLSVYMDKTANSARVQALAQQLRLRGDVAVVRVITADQALAEFRDYSGFGKALDALSDNPLPDTLIVTPSIVASTPAGTDALEHEIASMADVQAVQLGEAAACDIGCLASRGIAHRRPVGDGSRTRRRQHHSA
jgi:cell division transport system permease protein